LSDIQNQQSAVCEGMIDALLMPGAYLAGIKSVREVMRDDDFRRLYGHMLLHEIMPRLQGKREDVQDMALTLSQKLELSRDAVITRLPCCISFCKDWAMPFIKENTPCLMLGLAMMLMLFAGPHDDIREKEDALALFTGLSPDMTADSLVYAVFGDREFWGWDILSDEEFCYALQSRVTDLQILGVRGAVKKCFDEISETMN